MISPDDMTQVLGWMQAAGIGELTVRDGEELLRLKLDSDSERSDNPIEKTQTAELHPIKTTSMGYFLGTHPQRTQPEVAIGDLVSKGQIVAYLQLKDTLTAITADVSGTVVDVLANDGDLLGYATPVIQIQRSTEPC